jgi:predicted amidohydrolase YtcJ
MNCVLNNCKILTWVNGKASISFPASVIVINGKISALDHNASYDTNSRPLDTIIDLKGKVLLPGFTDTHTHFVEHAKSLFLLDLSSCVSIYDIRDTAAKYRNRHADLPEWILGGGWDANSIDHPQKIDRHLLDQVFPDVPVALFSKDYHAKWCNSLALKICGISPQTPDPYGGVIARDISGEPTGLVYEAATELFDHYIIQPTDTDILKAIQTRLEEMYRWGLTGFHSMEGTHSISLIRQCLANGSKFRCCWHFPLEELDPMISRGTRSYTFAEGITIGGVKIFSDGALGSRTAAMLQPYTGMDSYGVLRYDQDELTAMIDKASDSGIACTIHAIGDRAVHEVASAFMQRREHHPNEQLGHRMEHAQCVATPDIMLMKRSGLYCALQPVHLANDIPMVETHWKEVASRAYPWVDIIAAGIPYGFGSDTPIETNDPFLGIYCATQRRYRNDPNNPCWHPDQAISIDQALYGYTLGAAEGSRENHLRGNIAVGMDADLMVLDDWTNGPVEFWLNCRSRLTMVGGEIVWNDL